jgi:hypothetical protein
MHAKFVHRTVLIALLALAFPAASFAGFFGIGVTVGFPPPPLPTYVQPPCPASGYIWTPGYWAYSNGEEDYYWVPGTWVTAPSFGLLWTPGYWRFVDTGYVWQEGYWGPQVGFYGGINYGFGYFGSGFVGGYWRDRDFYYNRAVTNISNVNITNVYNRTVMSNNFYGSRPSFNGRNGVEARPTHSDLLAARQPRRAITAPQRYQATSALALPSSRASVNHGHPEVAATPRPGISHGPAGAARRYASTPAPSAHSTRNEPSHSSSPNRVAALHSPSVNPRSQPPVTPQFASRTAGTPTAESRAPLARWSPPASYRPASVYTPPSRQSFAQAPRAAPAPRNLPAPRSAAAARNAPAPRNVPAPRSAAAPRNVPAPRSAGVPRSAPAFRSYSPPPPVNHPSAAQNQRRG